MPNCLLNCNRFCLLEYCQKHFSGLDLYQEIVNPYEFDNHAREQNVSKFELVHLLFHITNEGRA